MSMPMGINSQEVLSWATVAPSREPAGIKPTFTPHRNNTRPR